MERLRNAARTTSTSADCPVEIPSGSKQCPEKPESLTAESAVSYARKYEYARTYNHLDSDPQVNVNCEARLERDAERGFYVMVACGGSSSGWGGTGDTGKTSVLYYVDDETTLRVGHSKSFAFEQPYHAPDDSENLVAPMSGAGADFSLYNFTDESREVSVDISFLDSGSEEQVMTEEYHVDAVSGLRQREVSVRVGQHRVRASTPDGGEAEYIWELTSRGALSWQSLAVVVTREGQVQIWMTELTNVI